MISDDASLAPTSIVLLLLLSNLTKMPGKWSSMPTVMAYATGLIKNNAQFTQFNAGAEYTILADGQAVWTGKVSYITHVLC